MGIITFAEAEKLSKSRDSQRCTCKFCGRLMADDKDVEIYNSSENFGLKRPDLCWSISSDEVCDAYLSIHNALVELKILKESHEIVHKNIIHLMEEIQ